MLDHIYTNLTENKTSTKCILYDISDHIPVITVITERNIKTKTADRKIIRDLRKFKPEEFKSDLSNQLNNFNFNVTDINQLWNNFETLFNNTINKHAPRRAQTRKECRLSRKPYLTKEILRSIKIKQNLFKRAVKESSHLS